MDYWKNPEVMEAEENLEHLMDEVPLGDQANTRPEIEKSSPPADQYSFPAQRRNIFLLVVWKHSSCLSATDAECVSTLRKPYPGRL